MRGFLLPLKNIHKHQVSLLICINAFTLLKLPLLSMGSFTHLIKGNKKGSLRAFYEKFGQGYFSSKMSWMFAKSDLPSIISSGVRPESS